MHARVDAAAPADAENAPTGTWKTAQNAVSHRAHTHHRAVREEEKRQPKLRNVNPHSHTKFRTLPAAVSIPSNIAEGQGFGSDGKFLHHLHISYGSLRELETQVMLATRLRYLNDVEPLLEQCSEVGRLLNGLMKSMGR